MGAEMNLISIVSELLLENSTNTVEEEVIVHELPVKVKKEELFEIDYYSPFGVKDTVVLLSQLDIWGLYALDQNTLITVRIARRVDAPTRAEIFDDMRTWAGRGMHATAKAQDWIDHLYYYLS